MPREEQNTEQNNASLAGWAVSEEVNEIITAVPSDS